MSRSVLFGALACALLAGCAPKCPDGDCDSKTPICPPGLEASFGSINQRLFSVSCGTTSSRCHSGAGAIDSGGLDLASDAYLALLGANGTGEPAHNISGSVKALLRVAPGDPDQSFLVIKLMTQVGNDPRYGSGMPFTNPGALCAADLEQIKTWIANGARND